MRKNISITELPKVGDIVITKTLKIKRSVKAVEGNLITIEPLRSNKTPCIFETLAGNYTKTLSFEDLQNSYEIPKAQPALITRLFAPGQCVAEQRINVTSVELKNVIIKTGDVWISKDDKERIIISSMAGNSKDFYLLVISMDKMFGNEYIEYQIKETQLLDMFFKESKQDIFNENKRYSISFG